MRQQSPRSSERVEPEAFSRRVAASLGDGLGLADVEARVVHGQVHVSVPAQRVAEAAGILRAHPDLACEYLTFVSAVDWQEEGFEVLVVAFSLQYLNTVALHVRLPATDPHMPTLTGVWRGTNWHERETAEMFGIVFDDHPNLIKLYLPEDFEGHPLRKSFQLASRTYKPWPGAKDPEEAETGGR
ncbi:MAG: NADH-quinone oxidoreductase subunit C [Actinomycetota bacterium]